MKPVSLALVSLFFAAPAAHAQDLGFTCTAVEPDGSFFEVDAELDSLTYTRLELQDGGYSVAQSVQAAISDWSIQNDFLGLEATVGLAGHTQRLDIDVRIDGGFVGYLGHPKPGSLTVRHVILNTFTGEPAVMDERVLNANCLVRPLPQ